ncbi:cold-shock protein [Kocuria sp. CPCC 205231]|uniref:cold-shock protein n=1 Tax=Kocuria sp. CPCC 205231 TaxID=3073551 RepID=UPI0034D52962
MATGVVKWFDSEKGYGFIRPDDGSEDVFVNLTAVTGGPTKAPRQNDRVEYEADARPHGSHASQVTVVS